MVDGERPLALEEDSDLLELSEEAVDLDLVSVVPASAEESELVDSEVSAPTEASVLLSALVSAHLVPSAALAVVWVAVSADLEA